LYQLKLNLFGIIHLLDVVYEINTFIMLLISNVVFL